MNRDVRTPVNLTCKTLESHDQERSDALNRNIFLQKIQWIYLNHFMEVATYSNAHAKF